MAKKEKQSGRSKNSGLAARLQEKIEVQREAALKAKEQPKSQTQLKSQPQSKSQPQPKFKPRSAADRKKDRRDGIIKTVFAAALGIMAGFACYFGASAMGSDPWQIGVLPWHFVLMSVVLGTYLIQRVVYPLMKIDAASFKTKDWLYVEFIAVDLWLVTWTILLNPSPMG